MATPDLMLSKLGAGRVKDIDFARSAAALGLLQHAELVRRLEAVACSYENRGRIEARINALFTCASLALVVDSREYPRQPIGQGRNRTSDTRISWPAAAAKR